MGRSDAFVRDEKVEEPVCVVEYDGRRTSDVPDAVLFGMLPAGALEETVTAEDSGAESVFFIRENMDVTRVYEDWSCSSSAEKGLNEVRPCGISSVSLVLLLDLEDWPLKDPIKGEVALGDSMVKIGLGRLKRKEHR